MFRPGYMSSGEVSAVAGSCVVLEIGKRFEEIDSDEIDTCGISSVGSGEFAYTKPVGFTILLYASAGFSRTASGG